MPDNYCHGRLYKQKKWDTTIGPTTGDDKVDIGQKKLNHKLSITYQVKSSINNFDKCDILDWLIKLINDSIKPKEYKSLLIGNYSDTTKTLLNNFKSDIVKSVADSVYSPLITAKDKIVMDYVFAN